MKEIERIIDSHKLDRSKTLPVNIKTRGNNIIVTWNIYSEDKPSLNKLFHVITDKIVQILENIEGENIHLVFNTGKIIDTGIQEFQVNFGESWDIYLYEPEIFIYIRLLLESRIGKPKERWISLDIDVVNKSAWFL